MSFATVQLSVPLESSSDGVLRIGGTRVTLDTLVEAYREGFSAEEIAQQYPSLKLADVYSVLSYLLRQSAEVEQYLQQRQVAGSEVRLENEARFPAVGVRERLLARQGHA
jgi:uncharacterized protein (DUF433 family)